VQVVSDANGNTLLQGELSLYHYTDNRAFIIWGETGAGMYAYNGLGQRVYKAAGNESWTYYHHDDRGRLLSEHGRDGQVLKIYIWLDQTLLAIVRHDTDEDAVREPYETAQLFYVHTDHLGTPQRMTDTGQATVWTASYDPFGAAVVDEDPDNDGNGVVMNLRFPGQYYDAETGLHYNYFRYYDPGTGRYLRSDPIGLDGGLNTYGYVGGNPVKNMDPMGLFSILPAYITDPFFQSLVDAENQGYYDCLLDCLAGSFGAPLISLILGEGLTGFADYAGTPEWASRQYHTRLRKDGRFKAGGKRSRVLVPKTAEMIRRFGKGLTVFSFLLFYKELLVCTKDCLECTR